nr:hypothetical protein [Tanacetum cinerariifolium]
MPTGKIGVFTRFFEYANFRLPLSTFLVSVLKHYRIHISQLSVIAAAKVSHFEILCRVHGFEHTVVLFRCFYVNSKNKGWMSFSKRQGNNVVCYTKPLDSLKGWNDHLFWVDAFACPALFPWHNSKSVSKDPLPKSSQFNAKHYATLVVYPAPFHKYQIDLFSFIHTADPTKVRVGERQRAKDKPRLIDTTVGRVVPLLPVAHAHSSSELAASVEKLFDEGVSSGHVKQGDSASGGQGAGTQLVGGTAEVTAEDVASLLPRRQKKRKADAVQRLLAGAVQNAEVRGEVAPTLPFVTSYVSATPEHEGGDHTDSASRADLRTFGPPPRPSALVVAAAITTTSIVDPAIVVKEKTVKPSIFSADSASAGRTNLAIGDFTDLSGYDFLVGGIRTVISIDTDIQKVYMPYWSVTNGARLDDGRIFCEMVDEERRRMKSVVEEKDTLLTARDEEIRSLKAQLLLKEVEAAKAIRLCAKDSNFKAVEKSLQGEVEALKERSYTLEKEKNELNVKVADLAASVKVKEQEVADLDAQLTSVKSHNDSLVDQLEKFQNEQMRVVNDKFDKLHADFVEMALHLEERLYPYLLTTISCRMWLLAHDVDLAIVECLNSPEYLSALGAAISKSIENGMQDGLAAGIDHGKEGRVLTDVAAYNPSMEDDYVSALQDLHNVNLPLLSELKVNKDASVETLMNILRLENVLAERLGLNDSQPRVDQLMKIKNNIANQRSALRDVFVPLVEPFSSAVLMGTEGTPSTAAGVTTALSMAFASTSFVPLLSTNDYEIMGVVGQGGASAKSQVVSEHADPFPNVDDVDLNNLK